ncbi:amino acid permease [Curtobacterium sp. MCLR17_043]|jgi:urea carboxylase system permease|uniref:APC family permease n=1 Tax=Curtobacterium TaxID=2034 RepID=UPI000D8B7F42|nr:MULTISPECIES: amino acid permease [Curtobacterium]MBB1195888.1 amino acid permease [Curtobacterium flaccumfaciens]MBF4594869.1 amino acid permease [Curtobacterium flaccumfaciens]MBF4626051.1 amino acid permease [Curtobacterium flaccumfaciens]MBO9055441.1 amino acid permease [Curtobacterium flaccumfaciens pv. flaccumfaciens]MBT1632551.1 amino acid permease [Curtobacterium flaccumfaciens pv. oortii]
MRSPQAPLHAPRATSDVDTQGLARLGYEQELHRGVGSFSSFAAGFSFVSILTTVFQLFGLGFGLGGAAFFWAWPLVFGGQLLVALNFAQLAARWPISGAIFQWSSRLAGARFGWFTGWTMIIGQILTVAVAAIAVQAVLPAIWDGFQVVGGPGADPSVASPTGAANAVVLGLVMLAVTTIVNITSVRLMARVTSFGVLIEIIGVVVLIGALFLLPHRSASVVFTTAGSTSTEPYVWAFLASSLMAAYVMVGFDSAGELAEETHNPRRTTPKTIVRALTVSGLGGGLLIIGALVAAPSLTDGKLATQGLAWVITSTLGDVFGRLLLCTVAVAVFACTLAVQTAGARMVYSMAREKALPFHRTLARVSPRTGTPIAASIVVGVGAGLALAVNIGQSAIFTALSSLCIAMLYLAYLGVTGPLLVQRIKLRRTGLPTGVDEDGKPLFTLGRWGIPLNALAVAFQIGMAINLIWPRPEIYDLTGTSWWLQYSALLFIGGVLLVGWAWSSWRHRTHGPITLAEVPTTAAVPVPAAATAASPTAASVEA